MSATPSAAPQGRTVGRVIRVIRVVRDAWSVLAIPVMAVLLGLVVGAIVILVSSLAVPVPGKGFDPFLWATAYRALLQGALGSWDSIVHTLVLTTPLLLCGLGVGIGFKAGLFNIGAQGQFLVGAVGASAVGAMMSDQPVVVAVPVALLAGMAMGGAWGFLPGLLKATSGAHEVVTTIMMNYIAVSTLAWAVTGPLHQRNVLSPITNDVGNAALPILMGRDGHLGIFIAFLAVPIAWFVLYRTTGGFEIRAVGANPDAARYAGMKPKRLTVMTMSIAGGLAGLAGAINLLGINHQMTPSFSTTVGFDSITVALLGRSNPIGVMFAALLFGIMRAGGGPMQIQAGVPAELVDVVQAIILFFLVANVVLRRLMRMGAKGPDTAAIESTITRSYGREGVA